MFVKSPHGRLVHFAFPLVETGWEEVPLKDVGLFGGWSSFSMCGQGWGEQAVDGPATCAKCLKRMGELILELQTVQTNVLSTKRLLTAVLP